MNVNNLQALLRIRASLWSDPDPTVYVLIDNSFTVISNSKVNFVQYWSCTVLLQIFLFRFRIRQRIIIVRIRNTVCKPPNITIKLYFNI
jgi:hypothetical protein